MALALAPRGAVDEVGSFELCGRRDGDFVAAYRTAIEESTEPGDREGADRILTGDLKRSNFQLVGLYMRSMRWRAMSHLDCWISWGEELGRLSQASAGSRCG